MYQSTTADRVLTVVLHDVRTPLGVASGYLRLLEEGRFPTDDARARVIEKARQALGRIAQTCEDAAALTDEMASASTTLVTAQTLVDRVAAELGAHTGGGALQVERPVAGRIGITISTDLVAGAVAQVLRVAAGAEPPLVHGVDAHGSHLRFWTRRAAEPESDEGEWLPYDPWQRGGLTLPLACQRIALSGGQVWTTAARTTVAVTFPVESN